MSLRDPEFAEALDGFYHTSWLVKEPDLPVNKVRCLHVSLRGSCRRLAEVAGSVYAVSAYRVLH